MRLDEALRTHLRSQPAVLAIFGARIYPGFAPQGAVAPLLSYDAGASEEPQTHTGGIGIVETEITLSVEAADHEQAREHALTVRAALEARCEVWGDLTIYRVQARSGGVPDFDEATQTWVAPVLVRVHHAKET